MRLIYVHQYFRTPQQGGAIRSYHIALALVQAGHEVTMVTAHAGPYERVEIDGIDLRYLPVPYENGMGGRARLRAFWRFAQLARAEILRESQADLLYLTSTPLSVGLIGLWIGQKQGWPYLFEVRDLWPEAPLQLGALPRWLGPPLRWLERRIYHRARALIALSPGMQAGVQQVVPERTVHLIPNFADRDAFGQLPPRAETEEQLGWPHCFRILYAGAMGRANGLNALLDLAKQLPTGQVEVVLVGEGAERARLQARAKLIENVRTLPPVNKAGLRDLLAVSDAMYVSFAPYPILETNSPNKFFDGLAAGKLMLVNVHGWLQNLVEVHGCGLYLDPRQPEAAWERLRPYVREKQRLAKAQAAARELAREFDREALCDEVVTIVEAAGRV